jgi:hypothetical protein
VALAAMVLVLGACRTDRELTEPEPEPVTADALAEVLPTEEDLPTGFTEHDGTPIATEVLTEHGCDDALADLAPKLEESVGFSGPGVELTSTAAYFPGQGGAVAQLLLDVGAACAQVVVADAGISVRTGPVAFGVLSDNTTSVRFEIEPTSGPIVERDLVLIVDGDLVNLIRLDGPRPSNKGLIDQVVRVSLDRLHHLYDTTT